MQQSRKGGWRVPNLEDAWREVAIDPELLPVHSLMHGAACKVNRHCPLDNAPGTSAF